MAAGPIGVLCAGLPGEFLPVDGVPSRIDPFCRTKQHQRSEQSHNRDHDQCNESERNVDWWHDLIGQGENNPTAAGNTPTAVGVNRQQRAGGIRHHWPMSESAALTHEIAPLACSVAAWQWNNACPSA